MDLFSAPSWDDGDVCEKINKKLLGSGTESTVSASNKKSRKAAKKLAKLEKNQISSPNQADVSVNSSYHVDSLKKDLLSELKCKFAKKRKSDSSNAEEGIISPPVKRKKVTFNNEAEVVLIDSEEPVHVSPKKKKIKEKKQSAKPTGDDAESATLNQPSGKFKLSSLLSKLSKKLDKQDEKEKQAKKTVTNNSNKEFASTPNSINGKNKKKKKPKVPQLSEETIVEPESTPSEIVNSSPESKKQKKKKNKLAAGNANEATGKNNILVNTPPKTPEEKKLAYKAKKKLRKERKKLNKGTPGVGLQNASQTSAPKTQAASISVSSSPKPPNAKQLKLQKRLEVADTSPTPPSEDQSERKTAIRRPPKTLREKMMRKLHASRFRYLNEQMYLSKGNESLEYFKTDPQAFQAYHQGYRQQVERWPLNPLDKIINMLKRKPQLVVADFGCGDARLARSIPNKVHSFDLVALSDLVTACDMAHTPLDNAVVDVAVFCLSLMGTNLNDYLKEANRVLKQGGSLKIAEVESRFDDVDKFIKNVQRYGFNFVNKDLSNDLFYFMDFHKVENISGKKAKQSALPTVSLRPCYYKKR